MAKKCIKLGLLTTEVWLIRPWQQLHRHWLNKYSSHQHLNNSPDLLADQDKDLNKYHCCFSSDPEKDDKRKKKQIFILVEAGFPRSCGSHKRYCLASLNPIEFQIIFQKTYAASTKIQRVFTISLQKYLFWKKLFFIPFSFQSRITDSKLIKKTNQLSRTQPERNNMAAQIYNVWDGTPTMKNIDKP